MPIDTSNLTPEQRKFVGSQYQISNRYQNFVLSPQDIAVPSLQKSDNVKLCMGEKVPYNANAQSPQKREKTVVEKYKENMNKGADTKFLMQPYGRFAKQNMDLHQLVGERNPPPYGDVKDRMGTMEGDLIQGVVSNTLPKGTNFLDINDLVANSSRSRHNNRPTPTSATTTTTKSMDIKNLSGQELIHAQMRFQKNMVKELKRMQQDDAGVSKCVHNIPGFPFVKADASTLKTNWLEQLEDRPSPAANPWRRKSLDGTQIRDVIKGGRAFHSHKTGIDETMTDESTWTHLYGNQVGVTRGIYFKPTKQSDAFATPPQWNMTFAPYSKPLIQ